MNYLYILKIIFNIYGTKNLIAAHSWAFYSDFFTAISEHIFREKERLKKKELSQTNHCPHESDLNYPGKLSV